MILKYFFLLLHILFCHAANAQTDRVTIRLSTQSKSVYLTAPPVLPVYLNPIELYGDSAAVNTRVIRKGEKELWLKFTID